MLDLDWVCDTKILNQLLQSAMNVTQLSVRMGRVIEADL